MKNQRTITVPGKGPEDTLFDDNGHVYSGLKDEGTIVRANIETGECKIIATPGGLPCGLEWMPDGRILLCNARLGLQAINVDTGAVEAIEAKGITFNLCNNAHVMADGTILVSDSSLRYPLEVYEKDLIENTCSGRLIKVNPDRTAKILLDGISFANGVVCLDDGETVLVAETAKSKIHAVNIDGSNPRLFIDVGIIPDNLSIGTDGNIWLACPSLPNAALEKLHAAPLFLRKIASSLPKFLQPKPALCCIVQVYSQSGALLHTYEGDTDIYSFVTGVREHNGKVAMGSIEHNSVSVFDV